MDKAIHPFEPARYDAEAAFGIVQRGVIEKDKSVVGYKANAFNPHSARIPRPTANYIFRRNLLRDLFLWHSMNHGEGLYLSGPTGCGKSSIIREVCARLRIPLLSAIGHQAMEIPELIGGLGVKDGATFFREGPLTIALRNGFWFLLDEVDLLNPGTATALNQILDGSGLTILETGEFVRAHPYFRMIVTGNTFGDGLSEHFPGTQKMNLAFLDRFIKVKVEYPQEDEEIRLLDTVIPSVAADIKMKMLALANQVRKAFLSDQDCNVTISTRNLIKWAKYAQSVNPILIAAQLQKDRNGHDDPLLSDPLFQGESDLAFDAYYYSLQRVVLFQADEASEKAITSMFRNQFETRRSS